MSLRSQVAEFHRAFGVPAHETPRVPDDERVLLRLRLIAEEFCELLTAAGVDEEYVEDVESTISSALDLDNLLEETDLVELADALGDLDYVVEGTRLEFGIDGAPIADAIHASNMKKLGGAIREDGKITKPAGWLAPDIAGCLRAQGWDGGSDV